MRSSAQNIELKSGVVRAIKHSAIAERLFTALASCFLFLSSSSQDIHFTQFFTNPLIINPGQTGYFDGNYRIGFNFKSQWPWATHPSVFNYHTETPYVDFSFGERKIKVGWMGIGFNFLNDEAGDGRLTSRRFTLSYAYHQAFDKDHRYILSAGIGLSYEIRSIDFSKFYFNNQWIEDEGFNVALPTNESYQKESFSMVDLTAGLNFGAQVQEQVKLNFGFAMLHLNRPKHTFYNSNERLGFRYQANAGVEYKINEQVLLDVNAYYTYEKKASEITLGSMLGYGLYGKSHSHIEHTLYIGAYYRIKDALSPIIGYQFKQTRLLINYDVTLSKLIKPAKANGGLEISLVHVGSWYKQFNGKKLYCPRF